MYGIHTGKLQYPESTPPPPPSHEQLSDKDQEEKDTVSKEKNKMVKINCIFFFNFFIFKP